MPPDPPCFTPCLFHMRQFTISRKVSPLQQKILYEFEVWLEATKRQASLVTILLVGQAYLQVCTLNPSVSDTGKLVAQL